MKLFYRMMYFIPVFILISCQPSDKDKDIKEETCFGPLIEVFNNTNIRAVNNNGLKPTFNVPRGERDQAYCLIKMYTYHWNGGKGQVAGKIGIQDGRGNKKLWKAVSSNSPAGNKNVDWNMTVPELIIVRNSAGPYTVLDSHPASWSQNNLSQGKGFAKVWIQKYAEP